MKEEILKKVITKAEENGFKNNLGNPDWTYSDKNLGYFDNLIKEHVYEAIIFSHSFAKAFWKNYKSEGYWLWCKECNEWVGEAIWHEYPPYHGDCGKKVERKEKFDDYEWQNQLQNMVLEENPLEYLAKFLKGK